MDRVVIYGAGGLGRVVRDLLVQQRRAQIVGYLDSDAKLAGGEVDGLPIFGGIDRVPGLRWQGVTHAIVAIGNNAARIRTARQLVARGLRLASAIHPLASIASSAALGSHLIIGARVNICVHSRIEDDVVLMTGVNVDHDNVIESGAFLHTAVRLAGGVRVGRRAVLEIGASVIPGRTIGARARVAAGSIVISDVPEGAVAAGAPARVTNPTESPAGERQARKMSPV
ncbi:MAG: sugar acetyltransferase [Planctomycetota bacterium]|nr:MAG: sugar acetyltransferase [Planctomycetota bacterium]